MSWGGRAGSARPHVYLQTDRGQATVTRAEGTTRSTIGPRSAITRHVFASHVTRHVLAAAIYAGVTVMFCAGIVVHPLTATLTAMGDGFLTFWDFWWVHKALFDLHANPLRTTWLTYPHEISLVFHVLDLLDGVLTLPLQRFSPGLDGVTLAVNVAICLSFLLSALAAYAAALVVTDSWLPSVVAGLGYGFSAYHVSRADMPVTAALYWLPLFAVLAVRAIRDGASGAWPRWAPASGSARFSRHTTRCSSCCSLPSSRSLPCATGSTGGWSCRVSRLSGSQSASGPPPCSPSSASSCSATTTRRPGCPWGSL